jgi:hypothetical protein
MPNASNNVGAWFGTDHLSASLLATVASNPHPRLIVVDPAARKSLSEGD